MKRTILALSMTLTLAFSGIAVADDGPVRVIVGEAGVRYLLDGHNKAVQLGHYTFYSVASNAPGSTVCANPGCATATVVDAFATPNPAVVAAAAAAAQPRAAASTTTSTAASPATQAAAAPATAARAAAAPAAVASKPKTLPSTSTAFPSDPGEPVDP